jgi:protein phosphatase 1G
MQLNF